MKRKMPNFLFSYIRILYIKGPKDWQKIDSLSPKYWGTKLMTKSAVFLFTSNKHAKKENREIIQFIVAIK